MEYPKSNRVIPLRVRSLILSQHLFGNDHRSTISHHIHRVRSLVWVLTVLNSLMHQERCTHAISSSGMAQILYFRIFFILQFNEAAYSVGTQYSHLMYSCTQHIYIPKLRILSFCIPLSRD
ncbi:hypothetical protein KC19_4G222200 [Ceratodon purpureus]|uniref:Uncharacterized protein n=1 Tax=Ceratodon purpureus TaxID=3225 RepID=A0A8T0IDU3_CERPU|nr:hypothetical protein KC19_4G222200 [Ceratodon purpureus]